MKTLKDLRNNIDEILKKNPEYENLPLIYSSDEEGNSFKLLYNDLTPMQVEDNTQYYLELVYDDEDEILEDDINCICIN
jgi:hypothetical protein